MKLFVWNINQRSSGKKIPPIVYEEIVKSNADIVILTEFIGAANEEGIELFKKQLNQQLENQSKPKYILRHNTTRQDANGVLIGVREGIGKILDKVEQLNTTRTNQPNFLQLDMVIDGKTVSIIGTRIQVGNVVGILEYLERHQQLLSLIEHIKTLKGKSENIIVTGDFNNSYIGGDKDKDRLKIRAKPYGEVRDFYMKNGKPKDTYDTYNYHIMRDEFFNNGMTVHTPENGYSWGFELSNNNEGYVQEDHVVITNSLSISNVEYSHSFMQTCKGRKPDHAILTADVKI